MRNLRNADLSAKHIDYCLNILGIRVWKNACQLVARTEVIYLEIPTDEKSLNGAASDTLRLPAWHYEMNI